MDMGYEINFEDNLLVRESPHKFNLNISLWDFFWSLKIRFYQTLKILTVWKGKNIISRLTDFNTITPKKYTSYGLSGDIPT